MVPMSRLTSVFGSFRARVVAARLESEGIDVQLRGALDSPYALTVGDLARVDLYVPDDQLEDARAVLVVDEAEATLALSPPAARGDGRAWIALLVLTVLAVVALAPLARWALH